MQVQKIERADGIQQVVLRGSLNMEGTLTAEMPLQTATAGPGRPTIFDMSGVDFISSIGIGLLVSCCGALKRKGAKVALYNLRPEIEGVFRVSKMKLIIPMVTDEAAALAEVG